MCVCNGTAEPHARSQHNTVNHCARSVARLCPTLGSPMGWSPPCSSVHGTLQQDSWSGLPCSPPGDLPHPGTGPASLASQATEPPGEPPKLTIL